MELAASTTLETHEAGGESNTDAVSNPGVTTQAVGMAGNALFFRKVNNRQVTPPVIHGLTTVDWQAPEQNDLEQSSKQWIAAYQKSGQMGSSKILARDLNPYVHYDLFPKLKFIMSTDQKHFSRIEGSFCLTICDAMGLVGNANMRGTQGHNPCNFELEMR